MEVWGGIECTINRVRNKYFDQLEASGHDIRDSDLEEIAKLGISKIRYPILWEKFQPVEAVPDWSWAEERLGRLRDLGIEPIVGFVHHGSGPRFTHLLDPEFGSKLANYARAFAIEFPWVKFYTPVNEPLTTARFSALYGFWYPHHSDSTSFLRALVNQAKAVVLAMKEIREVNPDAQLIQTEDFAEISSTPELKYQADFENERRWLSLDLILGNVKKGHPLYSYLLDLGVSRDDLDFFVAAQCRINSIGANHYLTSNRFLDHRLQYYPKHTHGGNGHDFYADVESIRMGEGFQMGGIESLLRKAFERFRLPLAITEVHLGGPAHDQIRWFMEIWKAATTLKKEGVDIQAVTAWSLLGTFDWNSLCTQVQNHYEPGIFELRNSQIFPTPLVAMIKSLVETGNFSHPILSSPGWWRRSTRILYPNKNLEHSDALTESQRRRIQMG